MSEIAEAPPANWRWNPRGATASAYGERPDIAHRMEDRAKTHEPRTGAAGIPNADILNLDGCALSPPHPFAATRGQTDGSYCT
jgi:hypothetical protein